MLLKLRLSSGKLLSVFAICECARSSTKDAVVLTIPSTLMMHYALMCETQILFRPFQSSSMCWTVASN